MGGWLGKRPVGEGGLAWGILKNKKASVAVGLCGCGRRAGVTRLSRPLAASVAGASELPPPALCAFEHVSGKERTAHMTALYHSQRSTCFPFVRLVPPPRLVLWCVRVCVCAVLPGFRLSHYRAFTLVNHACPGRHRAVPSLTSPVRKCKWHLSPFMPCVCFVCVGA